MRSYIKYVSELERYGNSAQVKVAKNILEWLQGIYIGFDLQHKLAEGIQRRVRDLLLIEDPKSDHFKFVSATLDSELDEFMNSENRIFYDLGGYQKPVVDGLEQYLYYQFRTAIGLNATSDMAKSINELTELVKSKDNTVYKDSKIPFMFAEQRAMQAPTLEFKAGDSFFEQKNEALKARIKMKFMTS